MNRRPHEPVLISCDGDLDIYATVEEAARSVEVYDLARCILYDARSLRLHAKLEGYDVLKLVPGDGTEEPDRLAELLRCFFQTLPRVHSSYVKQAESASSLEELVELRFILATSASKKSRPAQRIVERALQAFASRRRPQR